MTISKTLVPKAVELYKSGYTTEQIAKMINRDKGNIRRSLIKAGVTMRGPRECRLEVDDRKLAEARAKYDAGATTHGLAAELGLSISQMRHRLSLLGPMRQRDGHEYGPLGRPMKRMSYGYTSMAMAAMVSRAIKTGALKRQPCCKCGGDKKKSDGRSDISAHHCDYNKPLDVMWLCSKCHYQWHLVNDPIPLKIAAGIVVEGE